MNRVSTASIFMLFAAVQQTARVTREGKTVTTTGPDGKTNTSVSTGLSIGSKPDFKTVYRRTR